MLSKHGSFIQPEIKQSGGIYFLSGQSRKHNNGRDAAILVNVFPQDQKQHVHRHLAVYFMTDNLINYTWTSMLLHHIENTECVRVASMHIVRVTFSSTDSMFIPLVNNFHWHHHEQLPATVGYQQAIN